MAKYWIDPPQGYLYGFPKVFDTEAGEEVGDWLRSNGYTGEVTYVRMWPAASIDESEQEV